MEINILNIIVALINEPKLLLFILSYIIVTGIIFDFKTSSKVCCKIALTLSILLMIFR